VTNASSYLEDVLAALEHRATHDSGRHVPRFRTKKKKESTLRVIGSRLLQNELLPRFLSLSLSLSVSLSVSLLRARFLAVAARCQRPSSNDGVLAVLAVLRRAGKELSCISLSLSLSLSRALFLSPQQRKNTKKTVTPNARVPS